MMTIEWTTVIDFKLWLFSQYLYLHHDEAPCFCMVVRLSNSAWVP
jgi:hypothetical protein